MNIVIITPLMYIPGSIKVRLELPTAVARSPTGVIGVTVGWMLIQ